MVEVKLVFINVDNDGYYAGDVGALHLDLLQGRLLGLKEQWTEHR